MKRFSIRKLCFMMGSLGLVASGNVGAFPSAAWFPSASGTAVEFDSNGDPAFGFVDSIKPKPVYLNGQQGFLIDHRYKNENYNSGDFDVFSWANDGINYLGGRSRSGGDNGCTETFSPPVHVPDDITLGTPYTTTGTVTRICSGDPGNSGSGSFTATFTPLLFEDVIVPAGTYKALKEEFHLVATGGPFTGTDFTSLQWRAPKIGVIQDYDTESQGGPYTHKALFISSNVPNAGNADYDGDGRTDPTVFRESDGTWLSHLSSNNTDVTRHWGGVANDAAVQGDYDGDGVADFAVFRDSTGTWHILKSSTNFTTDFTRKWGASGDKTVQRDYDGDGVQDIAIYRQSTGYWYILKSSTGFTEDLVKKWGGGANDNPVPRDYDGDGKADLAVFRPSTGNWHILTSLSGYTTDVTYHWGTSGDQPLPRDVDGDDKADLVIYRPSNATWHVLFSSSGYTTSLSKQWGIPTGSYVAGTSDTPVSGDFDGDRIGDLAIFRPTDGKYLVLTSSSNFQSALVIDSQGTTGDLPLGRK